jgi:hypothetical protein
MAGPNTAIQAAVITGKLNMLKLVAGFEYSDFDYPEEKTNV